MSEWLLQIVLIVLGLLLFGGLIYSLVFSTRSRQTEERPVFTNYDRREPERMDRRKRKVAAPAETGDRRQGPRRTDE